jgi:hypothetical protein
MNTAWRVPPSEPTLSSKYALTMGHELQYDLTIADTEANSSGGGRSVTWPTPCKAGAPPPPAGEPPATDVADASCLQLGTSDCAKPHVAVVV